MGSGLAQIYARRVVDRVKMPCLQHATATDGKCLEEILRKSRDKRVHFSWKSACTDKGIAHKVLEEPRIRTEALHKCKHRNRAQPQRVQQATAVRKAISIDQSKTHRRIA